MLRLLLFLIISAAGCASVTTVHGTLTNNATGFQFEYRIAPTRKLPLELAAKQSEAMIELLGHRLYLRSDSDNSQSLLTTRSAGRVVSVPFNPMTNIWPEGMGLAYRVLNVAEQLASLSEVNAEDHDAFSEIATRLHGGGEFPIQARFESGYVIVGTIRVPGNR